MFGKVFGKKKAYYHKVTWNINNLSYSAENNYSKCDPKIPLEVHQSINNIISTGTNDNELKTMKTDYTSSYQCFQVFFMLTFCFLVTWPCIFYYSNKFQQQAEKYCRLATDKMLQLIEQYNNNHNASYAISLDTQRRGYVIIFKVEAKKQNINTNGINIQVSQPQQQMVVPMQMGYNPNIIQNNNQNNYFQQQQMPMQMQYNNQMGYNNNNNNINQNMQYQQSYIQQQQQYQQNMYSQNYNNNNVNVIPNQNIQQLEGEGEAKGNNNGTNEVNNTNNNNSKVTNE